MKVVNIAQRTPEWHRWRQTGVSASSASSVLGKNPYKSLQRLWAEKTGRLVEADISRNPHVRRGFRLEDKARLCCERELKEDFLLPVCGQSSSHPLFLASFDGLTDKNIPTELKCPCEKVFQEVLSKGEQSDSYKLYYPQVQHQILVADADFGWLMFYGPEDNGSHRLFRVERNDAFLRNLVNRVEAFWECVVNNVEPGRDFNCDLYVPRGESAHKWQSLAVDYRALEQQALIYAEQLNSIKNKMKLVQDDLASLMGSAQRAEYAGVSVTQYAKKGVIDYDKFFSEKLPDMDKSLLEAYRRESTSHYRVNVTDYSAPKLVIDPEVKEFFSQSSDAFDGDIETSYF